MLQSKYFKNSKVEKRSQYLNPFAYTLMEVMVDWLELKGVSPIITDTVSTLKEDFAIGRKSQTHREGRAFDIRTQGWGKGLIKEFQETFNRLYGKNGAISKVTNQPNLILHHDTGSGPHMHVQLNRSYLVKLPVDLDASV